MAISKAKRIAAARKAALTRKRRAAGKKAAVTKRQMKIKQIRKNAANNAINKIKTVGSSEDFTLKINVLRKFTKQFEDRFQCKCCKEYFTPHFLNIDHILGKTEMLQIKPLLKINYNERRTGKQLLAWLKSNLDEKIVYKHFQILCWNCNITKFLYKTCPHQRKLFSNIPNKL